MTQELLLARRLLEAVVDPDASPVDSDGAAAELAELRVRLGVAEGEVLKISTFDGMKSSDLSPSAWLFLIENSGEEQPELPDEILEDLFLTCSDVAVRFRLISGVLAQPRTRRLYAEAMEFDPQPFHVEALPASWPRRRLETLATLATTAADADSAEPAQALAELVLYLIQDGSEAALGLAAAAVAPADAWRIPARVFAGGVVRAVDPELTGFGRAFGRANI